MAKRNRGSLGVAGWGVAAAIVGSSWLLVACGPRSVDDEPPVTNYSPDSCREAGGLPMPNGSGPPTEADCPSGMALGTIDWPSSGWHEGGFCCAVGDDPVPSVKACGARAGASCSASEYCAYEAGQLCGAADAEATCKPRPEDCIELYAPVCGCDQKTYANSCIANAAGTGILGSGACEPSSVDEDPSCYSPTKNLAHAYEAGAQGCACDDEEDADVCVQGVALICEQGAWQAVEDGPCWVN